MRGNEITVNGPAAEEVARLFEELVMLVQQGHSLDTASLRRSMDMVHEDQRPSAVLTEQLMRSAKGKPVRPKTAGQKRYVDAIRENVITFGIGPAGTGKSWLAVAMAVHALQAKEVSRIILTRPAVEAGERLGFLPGDLMAKIDPYLRPLYDALHDMIEPEGAQKLLERQAVEVAPLAFMRGRTLNNSFIILDEAQNATPEQMQMFLTRLGFGSRVVITGDITQIDLPRDQASGLIQVRDILGSPLLTDIFHSDRWDYVFSIRRPGAETLIELTDGRELPKDPEPRWMGYSTGKWEDDNTFVATTVGVDGRTWLDKSGRPHSEDMRVEERFHRVAKDMLEFTVTINDPSMYTAPWKPLDKFHMKLLPANVEPIEMLCSVSEYMLYNEQMKFGNPTAGTGGQRPPRKE